MENCIFCKISKKEIPAEIVFENEEMIAFKDINPITPIHILLVPKTHIPSVDDISSGTEAKLMGNLILEATKIAKKLGVSAGGYKLLFRVGVNGGQEVEHVHLHLLGGVKLYEEIRAQEQT